MVKVGQSKRRQPRRRDDDSDSEGVPASSAPDVSNPGSNLSSTLEDVMELRKLRRRKAGVDTAELGKGDNIKKVKTINDDPWKLKSGGGIINIDEVRGRSFGEDGNAGSFATESDAMDSERLMQEFIEKELRKRRGATEGDQAEDGQSRPISDPHDELFQIPEHLQTREKPVNEGSVTLSTTMLTAIPEVDLGVSVKLKNIEETEKAKRRLLEQASPKPQNPLKVEGATNMPGRNTLGFRYQLRHEDRQQPASGNLSRERATDDLVMERFKKRIRKH
ncbi:hepatocellular carcinoma-associated antigen 59-domain-containing protein [Gaertneriomyces semiglobifer]|nr:hepatocellular carcinoma-associated antigen 59-domain-containing protein [Gaertneriomyces semiglobifer]